MSWIVVNIGCIECGVSSNIVGVFDDEQRARATADELEDILNWREGGQNAFEVFPLPELNQMAEEYREALNGSEQSGNVTTSVTTGEVSE